MKTIEEAAKESCKNTICKRCGDKDICKQDETIFRCWATIEYFDSFKAGVEFATRWISVEECLPENETYINLKLKNGDLGARFYESIDKEMLLKTCTHWLPIN